MPYRTTPLVTGEYYHIFNRGVAHMPIFKDSKHFQRFLKSVQYYQIDGPKPRFSFFNPDIHKVDSAKKIVDIISYCLMPNHFHFLIKQNREGGISEFIRKECNSYTKYFNTKNNRIGPILQGEFKAVLIESNEQLLHVARYIHLNPLVSNLVIDLDEYEWSSYQEYIGINDKGVCSKDIILGQFKEVGEFIKFTLDQESYGRDLEFIKHQLLDV